MCRYSKQHNRRVEMYVKPSARLSLTSHNIYTQTRIAKKLFNVTLRWYHIELLHFIAVVVFCNKTLGKLFRPTGIFQRYGPKSRYYSCQKILTLI